MLGAQIPTADPAGTSAAKPEAKSSMRERNSAYVIQSYFPCSLLSILLDPRTGRSACSLQMFTKVSQT
eukprot:1952471-Rhodomonas_salina.1